MPTLGPWEVMLILIIVVLVFGAGRLSDAGSGLGKGVRAFRKASTTGDRRPTRPAAAPTAPVATTITVAPTALVAENTCPSCATLNPMSQAFCGQCGIRLNQAA